MSNPSPPLRRSYGPERSQYGVLSMPAGPPPYRVAILIHGGFWSLPWSLQMMEGPARDLVARGVAVWNVEYRRLGEPGGGWRGTFDDVRSAADALAALPECELLDLSSVVVAGHSAGGHLALWLAGEQRPSASGPLKIAGVAGLAAVTDLRLAWELGAGTPAVEALLGGPPYRYPDRFSVASPFERLPIGVPQLMVTGDRDRMVPAELSIRYAAAARRAGDLVTLRVLARTGHMDVIDSGKKAWKAAAEWIANTAEGV